MSQTDKNRADGTQKTSPQSVDRELSDLELKTTAAAGAAAKIPGPHK